MFAFWIELHSGSCVLESSADCHEHMKFEGKGGLGVAVDVWRCALDRETSDFVHDIIASRRCAKRA